MLFFDGREFVGREFRDVRLMVGNLGNSPDSAGLAFVGWGRLAAPAASTAQREIFGFAVRADRNCVFKNIISVSRSVRGGREFHGRGILNFSNHGREFGNSRPSMVGILH